MSGLFFGDMASATRNMRLTTQVKQNLDKYSYEVASGQKQDLAEAVSGDFSPLASIERSLQTLGSYEVAIKEAGLFANSMQTTLESVSTHVQELSTSMLRAEISTDATSVSVAATDARTRFDSVVSILNTRVGDRSLFSGTATGTTPLVSSEDMLADISAALTAASAASVSDMETVINDWFMAPGGGFETMAYQGSDNPLSSFALGENDSVRISVTAQDQGIRETLKGLAIASLVDDPIVTPGSPEQTDLLRLASETLLGAKAGVVDLQAKVGSAEARIEQADVTNNAATHTFSAAKAELTTADPYETASLLKQTETQLQLIYTLTARMSALTLADYIR